MLERLAEDRLAGMAATASEGARYANAKVEVTATDLAALVAEVEDHRTDARNHAKEFTDFHVWLAEWAASERGGRASWHAWYESMQRLHRDVSRHTAKWEILEPQDQVLHSLIAKSFVNAALADVGVVEEAHDGG